MKFLFLILLNIIYTFGGAFLETYKIIETPAAFALFGLICGTLLAILFEFD